MVAPDDAVLFTRDAVGKERHQTGLVENDVIQDGLRIRRVCSDQRVADILAGIDA